MRLDPLKSLLLICAATALPAVTSASERVPSLLLHLPESISTVFVAETSTSQFHRFDREGDGVVLIESFYMSIGKNGDGKQRSGDKRTPVGAYIVTEQLDTSRLHEKYGVTAFPLDYPNAWDRRLSRDGDGIWVHGVDPDGGKRPPLDTDGCIALPNEDLTLLQSLFQDNHTPVIVTRNIEWQEDGRDDAVADELRASIDRWLSSQTDQDLFDFLALYHPSFERWGMGIEAWAAFVAKHKQAANRLKVSDVLLLGYPDEADMYMSRFQLTDSGASRSTTKRLYWRRDDSGALKIIAEDEG